MHIKEVNNAQEPAKLSRRDTIIITCPSWKVSLSSFRLKKLSRKIISFRGYEENLSFYRLRDNLSLLQAWIFHKVEEPSQNRHNTGQTIMYQFESISFIILEHIARPSVWVIVLIGGAAPYQHVKCWYYGTGVMAAWKNQRFDVSKHTARYRRYVPVQQRTGMGSTLVHLSISCVGMLGTARYVPYQ